jgi:hypothetical protein
MVHKEEQQKKPTKEKRISSKNLELMISPLVLREGQHILLQNIKSKLWNVPRTITEVRGICRSALVKTSTGIFLRNRRFMRNPPGPAEGDEENQAGEREEGVIEGEEEEDEDYDIDDGTQSTDLTVFTVNGCMRTSLAP